MVAASPPPHVVIAGGTGFVGARLAQTLLSAGTPVTVLTRDPKSSAIPRGAAVAAWNPSDGASATAAAAAALQNAGAVVNLCGAPVVWRWSAAYKELLRASRVSVTSALVDAMLSLPPSARPTAFVNASAVGFYGHALADDAVVDEASGSGDDFLARLCVEWEGALAPLEGQGVRAVAARFGVVVGAGGGAVQKMAPFFAAFAGGPLGSGKQWMPWVHVDDVVAVLMRAAATEGSARPGDGDANAAGAGDDDVGDGMRGAYNVTAPAPVRMARFAGALGAAMRRPSLLPVPEVVLRVALGEASCVLLDGQNAVPKRLLEEGYEFAYPDIDSAMQAVVKEL